MHAVYFHTWHASGFLSLTHPTTHSLTYLQQLENPRLLSGPLVFYNTAIMPKSMRAFGSLTEAQRKRILRSQEWNSGRVARVNAMSNEEYRDYKKKEMNRKRDKSRAKKRLLNP